jgi:hypothetical protein
LSGTSLSGLSEFLDASNSCQTQLKRFVLIPHRKVIVSVMVSRFVVVVMVRVGWVGVKGTWCRRAGWIS